MFSPRRRYGRMSAVTVAALVIAVPAAIAVVPGMVSMSFGGSDGVEGAQAPPAPISGTPLATGLLRLDPATTLGLRAHGIAATPVDGATAARNGVGLSAGKGSRIAHAQKKLLGGQVRFDGGIRFTNGDRTVVVDHIAVDLGTRVVTATVGGTSDVRLGTLNETRGRLVPRDTSAPVGEGTPTGTPTGGTTFAMGRRLALDPAAGERIDEGLGVERVFAGEPGRADIYASFEAEAALNVDLAFALGLEADLGLDAAPLR
ncbi:hypothetical protein [Streptomyces hypolithicus]